MFETIAEWVNRNISVSKQYLKPFNNVQTINSKA